jgi:uncharacterized protein (DUF433 family)
MELPDFLTRNQYGEIRVTGHRIGLLHIVDLYNDGAVAEGILCQFPALSLPLIHKVIAFYLENQAEVDAYVSNTRADLERLAAAPSTAHDRGVAKAARSHATFWDELTHVAPFPDRRELA